MAKIIDNFKLLRKYLIPAFPDEKDTNDFWVVQIIKRRKDNPELPRGEKMIDTLYIHDRQEWDEIRPKIIEICEENNARAYINVNRRNYKTISLQMLKRIATDVADGSYKNCANAFNKSVGQHHSELFKNWVVDIDTDDDLEYIWHIIEECYEKSGEGAIELKVPTVSGVHLLAAPFDTKYFSQCCPGVDVHRDSVTLLYFKKLDNEELADSVLNECCIL